MSYKSQKIDVLAGVIRAACVMGVEAGITIPEFIRSVENEYARQKTEYAKAEVEAMRAIMNFKGVASG